MRWKRSIAGLGLALALAGGRALADGPAPLSGYSAYSTGPVAQAAPLVPTPQAAPAGQAQGANPQTPQVPIQPEGAGAAGQNLANQMAAPEAGTAPGAGEAGTEAGGTASPNMFGDYFGAPRVAVPRAAVASLRRHGPARQQLGSSPSSHDVSNDNPDFDEDDPVSVLTFAARGAFKITDDESPRPQDRVFLRYNYFNGVGASEAPPDLARTDVHREVIGFEKTFLDGNASIGMRLPFVEVQGEPDVRKNGVGDLSILFKYAFINDCTTHNVLSAGLVVTVPTGAAFEPTGAPDIHDVLLQPWLGGIYNAGDLYVQAFTSVLIPTKSDDIDIWFNDIGVGYYIYRCDDHDRALNFIAPTVETHVTTPLNHRGSAEGLQDIVDLTYGATFGLFNNSTVAIGFVTPVTGPKPFNWEGQAFWNLRF